MTTQAKSTEKQLEELIDEREFFISTTGTGQGKKIYMPDLELDTSDIYDETIHVNGKTVKVERLQDLKNEKRGPENWPSEWEWKVDGKWYDHHEVWEKAAYDVEMKLKKQGYDVPDFHAIGL